MSKQNAFKIKTQILKKAFDIINGLKKLKTISDEEVKKSITNCLMKELEETVKVLDARIDLSSEIGSFEHSEYGKKIASLIKSPVLLDKIKSILDSGYSDKEKEEIIDEIRWLEEQNEEDFYYDKAYQIQKYHAIKSECIYPDVIEFIDKYYIYICEEEFCTRALNIIIENFTEKTIDKAFSEFDIECILEDMYAISEEDLKTKNKETLIKLVNGVFLSYYSNIPLIKSKEFTEECGDKMMRRLVNYEKLS